MKISDILKNYKIKKAKVNTALKRIEELENFLKIDNLNEYYIFPTTKQLGMPIAKRNSSPVEYSIIGQELTHENVKELIACEKSRIFWINMEVTQIEEAIKSLNSTEKYLITSKYFDRLSWDNIEYNFNLNFKNFVREYKTCEALRLDLDRILRNKLIPILEPFYEKYGVI